MTNTSFFDESREQSLIKAEIVAKYFWAWAKIMIPRAKKMQQKIAYIDLFCGPGRYKDGSKSTPLLILERAIQDPEMRERLLTLFNDVDSTNTHSLQQAINSLPDLDSLKNKPVVLNEEVGEEIVQEFERTRLVPTLFFVDPWGYKGLSIRLIGSLIMNWGCDCIFFFNYNRINMGLRNTAVETHMNALFSKERADALRLTLNSKPTQERELIIVEAIAQALKEIGGEYVLPFRFKNETGKRTSHHLIFVSKHVLGYTIMKDIMAKESSTTEQGVPSFEYNPATISQPLLFELSRPLDHLADMLIEEFAGQTMTMEEVFNRHHIGKRYIKKNYKDILLKLEAEGKIIVNPSKRRKGTLADSVMITFPPK
jgi:three-Cys-motif partner protein